MILHLILFVMWGMVIGFAAYSIFGVTHGYAPGYNPIKALWEVYKYHGDRKARENDPSRALDAAGRRTLQGILAGQRPGATAAGDGAEPGTGDSPGLAPDLTEPLVGWRAWKVDGNTLRPVAHDRGEGWLPGVAMEAKCYSCSPAPSERCSCGLYAADELGGIQYSSGLIAYGQVALWGKVVQHSHGYRAQFGYPLWIKLRGRHSSEKAGLRAHAARLAEAYGVTVEIATDEEWRQVAKAQLDRSGISGIGGRAGATTGINLTQVHTALLSAYTPNVTTGPTAFMTPVGTVFNGTLHPTTATGNYTFAGPVQVTPQSGGTMMFTSYADYQTWYQHQMQHQAQVQAQAVAAQQAKVNARKKQLEEIRARIEIPKPGDTLRDMGTMLPAYDMEREPDE